MDAAAVDRLFMCFALLIVLVQWTPALLRQAGIGGSQALLIVGLNNLGTSRAPRSAAARRPLRSVSDAAASVCCSCLQRGRVGYLAEFNHTLELSAALSGFFLGVEHPDC